MDQASTIATLLNLLWHVGRCRGRSRSTRFLLFYSRYSDSNCIRGFPDVPVSAVGRRTVATNMTTLLIPEMNFTCNASVVGFIVSGRFLDDGLHPRVQIWHKSSESYYQVGNVSIHDGACVATQRIVGITYLCILQDNFRVSVQPGDIMGLELPARDTTDSDEILFTNRGPMNYIFRHSNQLNSNTNLSLNRSSVTAQQLPQIIFNLTSGKINHVLAILYLANHNN